MDKLPGYCGVMWSDPRTLTNLLQRTLSGTIARRGGEKMKDSEMSSGERKQEAMRENREVCQVSLAGLVFIAVLF